jgi:hypothetical protein
MHITLIAWGIHLRFDLNHDSAMPSASSSTASWQRLWDEAQPRLGAIQQSLTEQTLPSSRITRVGKLDAELLDQELVTVLEEPMVKALNLVNVSFLYVPPHSFPLSGIHKNSLPLKPASNQS